MIRKTQSSDITTSERTALRRRVTRFYLALNQKDWQSCFELIDPRLRSESKISSSQYAASLTAFMERYAAVNPWYVRISLHLEASRRQRDERPFAYVYIVWQDATRQFHMFRDRWVKDSGHWYTRVVGLVPQMQGAPDP